MTEAVTGEIPLALLWGSFAIIVAAWGIPLHLKDRHLQRKIYWTGWAIGALGIAVAVSYREGLRGFFLMLAFLGSMSVMIAIRDGAYLKICGRIIATDWLDRRPDPTDDAPRVSMPLTGDAVRNHVFSKPVGRLGYNPRQVDAFLRRVADHLDGHTSLSVDDVHNVQFDRPAPFTRGYAPEEVDAFLDAVAQSCR